MKTGKNVISDSVSITPLSRHYHASITPVSPQYHAIITPVSRQYHATSDYHFNLLLSFQWHAQATCATSGDGLYEGLDWLSAEMSKLP